VAVRSADDLAKLQERGLGSLVPAKTKVSVGMVNGRYIAGFDGELPASMPAEQYARAIELLEKHGKY